MRRGKYSGTLRCSSQTGTLLRMPVECLTGLEGVNLSWLALLKSTIKKEEDITRSSENLFEKMQICLKVKPDLPKPNRV